VLTHLLEHHLYVKAEKCEFHASSLSFLWFIVSPNQIKMDPEKLCGGPLHALTSPKVQFQWGPKAEEAFQRLKRLFTTAPVFTMPDPQLQFIVEVDACNQGVGAVLPQRSTSDNCIHPCAFLSRKLSPAERNYNISNRELLAIKVALEEWRHWLEGAEHTFIVWTDDKNLQYLRSAKRQNSHQARWPLFFSRFQFSLSYRPGVEECQT
ncbi:hypothetical protein L3Q82_008904, partial [Scortum barcoo]